MAGMVLMVERLESMRDELGAATLTATFETGHGMVSVVVERDSTMRLFVNGDEVPRSE